MADESARLWIEPGGGVKQWRELNKYKDGRNVAWICNYVNLLVNDDYMALPEGTALLLHRLWLAFATTRGHLPLDTAFLSRVCGQRVLRRQLDRLVDAGFIQFSVTKPSRKRYGFVTTSSRLTRAPGVGVGLKELKTPPSVPRGKAEANGAHADDDVAFDLPTDLTRPMPR